MINVTECDDYFTVQTYAERFDSNGRTSPYFTVCVQPDGQIEAEISGNDQVTPKLTEEEYNLMELLGWRKPSSGKDEDYGDFPNFWKEYPHETDGHVVAEDILTALIVVFQLKTTDNVGVGTRKLAEDLEEMNHLVRLPPEAWNAERKIFKIPLKESK